jgi:tellurium resistance protein TerD
MALNLVKGQSESISSSISKLRIGLGWEPNESLSNHEFDLDVSAFMLNENGKLLNDNYLVFYNSELRVLPENIFKIEPYNSTQYPNKERDYRLKTRPVDPDFSVHGSIDDTSGEVSEGGDDENMNIDLSKVSKDIKEIIIVASIYEYDVRNQNFGQVDDSYISIYDENSNTELYKFELNEDYSICTAIEFCRIYRRGDEWKVQAIGKGHSDGLNSLVSKYI